MLSVFQSALKLASLNIAGVCPEKLYNILMPDNQLTSLTIFTIGFGDCLKLLQKVPNLLTFHVTTLYSSSRIPRPVPHIQLDFLSSLKIHHKDGRLGLFLDHLTFPCLSSFKFCGDLGDSFLKVASMVERSSTLSPLLRLTLDILPLQAYVLDPCH